MYCELCIECLGFLGTSPKMPKTSSSEAIGVAPSGMG